MTGTTSEPGSLPRPEPGSLPRPEPVEGHPLIDAATASAEIDLDAFRGNLAAIREHLRRTRPTNPADLMVVVKADAYGHGMLSCAAAARADGVRWLGVASPGEALALRENGDNGRLLAWLYGPDEDLATAVAAEVDLAAHGIEQIAALSAAAAVAGHAARVHLKIDTGLSRNGCRPELWPELCEVAREAEEAGAIEVVAIWSHFACADIPDHPSVATQLQVFGEADRVARAAGLRPTLRHLANSPATLIVPESHFELVRVGIAAYGIDPAPGLAAAAGVDLTPVMTLRARLAQVKELQPGDGVSYGHTWTAPGSTTVAVVPLGYADGIPRRASNRAAVSWSGVQAPIRGVVCMDQFVIELGPEARVDVGDPVVVFGRADRGEPSAEEWAQWCETIGYEIVTRIGARISRVYPTMNESQGSA